jgi:hypothetical protein
MRDPHCCRCSRLHVMHRCSTAGAAGILTSNQGQAPTTKLCAITQDILEMAELRGVKSAVGALHVLAVSNIAALSFMA